MSKNRSRLKVWVYVLPAFASVQFVTSFPHGNYSNARRRQGRAPGDTVDNFQALARISSGISLEIGLMDDTITPENAVAELLHYGPSIKTNDIIGLDKTAIDDAINSLETLGKTLKSDKAVTDIEERLLFLQEIGTSFNAESFKNFTGKVDYESHLPLITGLGGVKADVTSMASKVKPVLPIFSTINQWSEKPDAALAARHKQSFSLAFQDFPLVENVVKSLDALFKSLEAGQGLRDKSTFIEQLKKEHKVRETLDKKVSFAKIESVKQQIKDVFDTRSIVFPSQKSIETVHNLIQSRKTSEKTSVQYTSGLPNGKMDLEKLHGDIGKKWVQSRVGNSSSVRDNLEKAFNSYKDLTSKLNRVEERWKSLVPQDSIEKKLTGLLALSKLPDASQSASNGIASIRGCDSGTMPDEADINSLTSIFNDIEDLNQKVDDVLAFKSKLAYTDQLKDLSVFKNILENANTMTGTDVEIVNKVVTDMMAEPKFTSLSQTLTKFETDLADLEALLTEIPGWVTKITTNLPALVTYHAKVLSKTVYLKYFPCLKQVGADGIAMKTAIETKKKLSLDGDFSSVRTIVKTIHESNDDLKTAVASADDFKNIHDPASTNLKDSFTGKVKALEMSEKLGKAVQGLMAIQSAYLAKNKLNTLLNDIPEIIQKSSTSSSLAKEHRDILAHLSDLKKTFTQIEAFQKTLNDAKSLRKKRAADFKSFDNVFVSADQIPGFTEDIEKIQKALVALDPNKPYSTEMDALKTLDLDFQKFGILAGKDSLPVIDDFFLEYTKKMSEVKTVVNPKPNPSPSSSGITGQRPITSSEPTTSGGGIWEFWKSPVFWVVLLLIFCFVCFMTWGLCRAKKKKAKRLADQREREKLIKLKDEEENAKETTKVAAQKKKEDEEKAEKEKKEEEERKKQEKEDAEMKAEDEKMARQADKRNLDFLQRQYKVKNDKLAEAEKKVKNLEKGNKGLEKRVKLMAAEKLRNVTTPMIIVGNVHLDVTPESPFSLSLTTWERFKYEYSDNKLCPDEYLTILCDKTAQVKALDRKWFTNWTERRDSKVPTLGEFRFVLDGYKDPYIHCNFMKIGLRRYFMPQGPLSGKEPTNASFFYQKYMDSTLEKHIAFLEQCGARIVIQLCSFDTGKKFICARYFIEKVKQTLEIGIYKVKTLKRRDAITGITISTDKYVLWTLRITNTKTKAIFEIDVLMFSGWPAKSAPLDYAIGLEMLAFADTYESDVVVQSSLGTGRAPTLVAIQYGLSVIFLQARTTFVDIFNEIRKHRLGAIECPAQATYVVQCVTESAMKMKGKHYLESHSRLDYLHRQFVAKKYDLWLVRMKNETEEQHKKRKEEAWQMDQDEMQKEINYLIHENMFRAMRAAEDRKGNQNAKTSISNESGGDKSKNASKESKESKNTKTLTQKSKKSKEKSKECQETAEEPTKNSEKGSKKTKRTKDQKRGGKSKEKSKEMTEETQKTDKSSKL